jgi:phosphatidylserine decarboxylase
MGEFDVILEDIFVNGMAQQEPQWFPLQSRRSGKKKSVVSGEVQIQFTLIDPLNLTASPDQVLQKFLALAGQTPSPDDDDEELLMRGDSNATDAEDDDESSSDEAQDESKKAEKREKRRRKLKLARLRKKVKSKSGYEYSSNGDVAGVLFLEIQKCTDLPPERNGKFPLAVRIYASSRRFSDEDYI